MAPTIVDKASINPPSVKREDVEGEEDALTEPIPLGIKLTGGIKLRDEGLTGKGVRVAVIDSGVDINHPGFQGTVKKQIWFRDGTPLSIDDHGTHVAGTIHLMAPEAELYDYRVFGERGTWSVTEAISTAIFEAVYDGCDVINMSLGGRWPDAGIRSAVKFAHSNNVIVVCASGNSGDSDPLTNERGYPALWDEAISIAAVGKQNELPVASFSSSNPQVDYAGIGVDVKSLKPGGGVQRMSGTSMACPHVAGFIAALLSKEKSDERIEDEIITSNNCCGFFEGAQSNPLFSLTNDVDDASLRKLLNLNYLVDIGLQGPDNLTGLGFLTYLNKEEFQSVWENR